MNRKMLETYRKMGRLEGIKEVRPLTKKEQRQYNTYAKQDRDNRTYAKYVREKAKLSGKLKKLSVIKSIEVDIASRFSAQGTPFMSAVDRPNFRKITNIKEKMKAFRTFKKNVNAKVKTFKIKKGSAVLSNIEFIEKRLGADYGFANLVAKLEEYLGGQSFEYYINRNDENKLSQVCENLITSYMYRYKDIYNSQQVKDKLYDAGIRVNIDSRILDWILNKN